MLNDFRPNLFTNKRVMTDQSMRGRLKFDEFRKLLEAITPKPEAKGG